MEQGGCRSDYRYGGQKKWGFLKVVSNIAFNSKAMIDAMFEHWEGGYEARFNQVVCQ